MSLGYMDAQIVPKDGRTLRVIAPVRVSDPTKQDERSLGDQRLKLDVIAFCCVSAAAPTFVQYYFNREFPLAFADEISILSYDSVVWAYIWRALELSM
jgi:hypothetical protein